MEHSKYSLERLGKALDMSLLTFPEKLWELVNDHSCEEIIWSHDGKSIIVPSIQNFIAEVLNNPTKPIFKTKNFSSFVRQLNLYGFRKISKESSRKLGKTMYSSKCEFKHPSFIKGKRELLQGVSRRYEPPRMNRDGRRARSVDFKGIVPFFPVGLPPVFSPLVQPWAWSPCCPSFHGQLPCSTTAGYQPVNQQSGFHTRLNTPSELQQPNGGAIPVCRREQSNSSYGHVTVNAPQLQGTRTAQSVNSFINSIYNCSQDVKCAKEENVSKDYQVFPASTERFFSHSFDSRPKVELISNKPQAANIANRNEQRSHANIQDMSRPSQHNIFFHSLGTDKSFHSRTEILSSSNKQCDEKLFNDKSFRQYESKEQKQR